MEKSYIAGLFDGDGCVKIGYRDWKGKNNFQNRCYYLTVQITNNFLPVLENIQKEFKGGIYRQKRMKITHSDTFMWIVTSKRGAKFLKEIYPFLRIKKDQAALALEFQKHIERWKRKRVRNPKEKKGADGADPISENEMKWRDNIYLQISKLKNPKVFRLRQPYRKTRLIRRKAEMPTPS